MSLQAHQVKAALEGLGVDRGKSGVDACESIIFDPDRYPFFRPGDIAIAQQRNQIVSNRALYRVLKIQNARIIIVKDQQIT